MLDNIKKFFRKFSKNNKLINEKGINKDTAKERLHLVLMQDRANMSADFLDLMKQEIIEVIKKYVDVDENQIDVKLTNKQNSDGTTGAPALYANIPIKGIKNETRKLTNPKRANNNIKQSKTVNNTNSKTQNTSNSKDVNINKKNTETNKPQNNANTSNNKLQNSENTSTPNKHTNSQKSNIDKSNNNQNLNKNTNDVKNNNGQNVNNKSANNEGQNTNNKSANNVGAKDVKQNSNVSKPKPANTYNINPNVKNNKNNNKKK